MAGPVAAAAAGLVIGLFCARLTKLYFGMLQISLGSLLWAIAFRWYSLTGGDDGLYERLGAHLACHLRRVLGKIDLGRSHPGRQNRAGRPAGRPSGHQRLHRVHGRRCRR